jgi:hypothetical protein
VSKEDCAILTDRLDQLCIGTDLKPALEAPVATDADVDEAPKDQDEDTPATESAVEVS